MIHSGAGAVSNGQSKPSESGSRAALAAQDLASKLTEHLGARSTIRMRKSGDSGSLTIDFSSLDRLDEICQKLGYSKKL